VILDHLREIKRKMKSRIQDIPGLQFRRINDPEGECFTLLTVFLPDRKSADAVAKKLNTTTVSHSGWHVYNNMEQILGKKMVTPQGCPFNCACYPDQVKYEKGMLPQTDRLLERAINISIGVVDRGLGSAFGIHPHSSDEEIERKAAELRRAVEGAQP
jgi:8-amino-3,8-dideoxy-alpha-D-manno-octulosonate transaminase